MPQPSHTKTLVLNSGRVTSNEVLRNLSRVSSRGSSTRASDVTADIALLAGCSSILPPALGSSDTDRTETALLVVGDDYAAGFRDGFNSSEASRRSSRRYVEGLEDGGEVRRVLRRRSAVKAPA